jgi:hypothetical protein
MDFGDVEVAAAVRDAVRQIVSDVVDQQVAGPRFGRVISINFVALTATVWFPSDPEPVPVKLFSSVIPGEWQERFGLGSGSGVPSSSIQGFGSIAVVQTFQGTQYITQILNGGQFSVDFAMAGSQMVSYDQFGNPGSALGAEYLYYVLWDTFGSTQQSALPSNGGPYAVRIGPFQNDNGGQPGSGAYEIDLVSNNGASYKYEFNMSLYYQMAENNGGSVNDRWFRLIAKTADEVDKSVNTQRTLNGTNFFDQGIGDWTGETNTSVTQSNTFSHSGTWSMKIQSTLLTATIAARENFTTKYKVVGGAQYQLAFWLMSPTLWADTRPAIDWYDGANALISTSMPSAIALTANVWSFETYTATAPSNAVTAVPRVRIGSSAPTSQAFYADEVFFRTADAVSKTDLSVDIAMRATVHGSADTDATHSPGELWIRIYIHWLDQILNPVWTVRVRNTNGFARAKSTKTGEPVYEYDLTPSDAVGYLGYHDANVGYTTNTGSYTLTPFGQWATGPWRNPDLSLAARAQEVLTGGGVISWDGTNFKWTQPFEIGGIGRSRHGLSVGKATLTMPTSGNIPVFPGGTTVTATSSGIPLAAGQALYFGIPPGVNGTIPNAAYFNGGLHGAGGLFICDNVNNSTIWSPPEWAVLIAYRGSDANQPEIKCGNGQTIDKWRVPTLLNSWVSFDGGTTFNLPGYTLIDGVVYLRGLVKSGTISTTLPVFAVPAGYRTSKELIFPTASNDLFGEVRVKADNNVYAYIGSTNWISFDSVRYRAEA